MSETTNNETVIIEPGHQSKATKVFNRLILLSLAVIGISLFIILGWALESENPLVVNNSPFPTRSVRENAEANGVIILNVDFCKNTNKKGEIRASFVSKSREIFLPVNKESLEKGCKKEELPVLIPKDLPADDYKLKFIVRYYLNPLKRSVPVNFESQKFHVDISGVEQPIL